MKKMVKTLKRGILFVVVIFLFASCKEAPVTERKQLILIPESSEIKLGEDAFSKIIKKSKLSNNRNIVDKVKKVGSSIAKASDRNNYK